MSLISTILQTYRKKGGKATLRFLRARFFPVKTRPIKDIAQYIPYFKGKKGIEIGGPSPIFSREVPLYPIIGSLDGCNFSNQTVWEGHIVQGDNYHYFEGKTGFQYICEASDLSGVPEEKYDFLLASHCLEHCANTLKTMEEWLRVVKKGGAVLLVLPDKRFTFDSRRPVTAFEHLQADFAANVDETDLTHLDEIVSLHDLSMDPAAGTQDEFRKRSQDNYNNRCLHHHVFDFRLLEKIYAHHNIKIVNTAFAKPYHQIILGIKQ